MQAGERLIELAAYQVEQETERQVAKIRNELAVPGRFICDCGQEISEGRWQAHPSARDCIDCATFRERRKRA